MKILLLVLFLLLCFIFTPLLLIWAVNTLFALSIAYSFINWLASLVIVLIIGRGA